MASKERIIELQKAYRIARVALEQIQRCATTSYVEGLASEALSAMYRLDQKAPLQGIVGHERKGRSHD